MENIKGWKDLTVQFNANSPARSIHSEVYSLCTKKIKFSSQNVRNKFLGRHNKTAYYITNRMHFQKSSPRRKRKDLALRELNSTTEKCPIISPQKHILTDICRDIWCAQEDTIICVIRQEKWTQISVCLWKPSAYIL